MPPREATVKQGLWLSLTSVEELVKGKTKKQATPLKPKWHETSSASDLDSKKIKEMDFGHMYDIIHLVEKYTEGIADWCVSLTV